MEFKEKFLNIIAELNAPKSQYNNFGKYAYRNCEDILMAVKPLLIKYRCILTITDDLVNIDGRFYVKSTSVLTDVDSDGRMEVSAYAREEQDRKGMDVAQVTGATSSYARKYSLNGLFCIDDNKDADSLNTQKKELSEAQIKRLYAIAKSVDITDEQIHKKINKEFQINSVKELSAEQYNKVVKDLENVKKK